MRVLGLAEIRASLDLLRAIAAMRAAVIAQSSGQCDTRRGGAHFALKMAGTFATRAHGMMILCAAESGETVAYFDDGGYLTDLRTAAVTAMVARELRRADTSVGILGTGAQARLQAELHAAVLPLATVHLWGRSRERAQVCARQIHERLPDVQVLVADSPAQVAARSKLIVTATAARGPLLRVADVQPGSHVAAVGADSVGKQELDPEILRRATLLLVDSLAQCEKLGELQHAPPERARAIEIGSFCATPTEFDRTGITVADFTGLGAEDLFIAEECYRGMSGENRG
jgi:ornithine cyclodeaminase